MTIRQRLSHIPWFHFILPLAFFLAEISIIIFYYRFEFNPDEGINLIKAFLVHQDFELYQEVWSDQPPLLTNLLAFTFNIFEPNVNLCRGLILIFSTILLWQTWFILYLLGGVLHAYIGCLFLIVSPQFWRLSISVMIGLPCITLALGAVISIVMWHVCKKNVWLVASALLLSLSVSTKLFTLFIAPIIVAGMLVEQILKHRFSSKEIRQPAIWLVIFISFSLIIFLAQIGIHNLHFLIGNHADARNIDVFQNRTLGRSLKNDYIIFLIGFTIWGTIIAFRRKQWLILYFAAWSISAYLLLVNHRPVWHHHVLLLLVPAIIMVGYTMGEIITAGIKLKRPYLRFRLSTVTAFFTLAVFLGTILLLGEQIKTTAKEIDDWLILNNSAEIASLIEQQFLTEIIKLKPQTDWIVTDSPMFAFRAGIPVPPSTAVLSQKQVLIGNTVERDLLAVINRYKPKQILLKRFDWSELTDNIKQDYKLKKEADNYRLYLRKDDR